jgi:hypothetical protein
MANEVPGGERAAGAEPAGAALVKHWRVLGSALDALVRSVRTKAPAVAQLAERTLAQWQHHPEVLLFGAGEITSGEHLALQAAGDAGQWVLPAWAAGLRRLRPRRDAGSDDMLRLAEELAALETSVVAFARFRDWLWTGGAAGFEVQLDTSAMELIEAADAEALLASTNDQRAEAARGKPEVPPPDGELDATSLRQEFGAPLEHYTQVAANARLHLLPDEITALRTFGDDLQWWAPAEVDLLAARPELQPGMPPARLAHRLVAQLGASASAGMMRFVLTLRADKDPWVRQVATALDAEPVGEAIARGAVLDDGQVVQALRDLLTSAPQSLRLRIASGILERSSGADAPLVTRFISWFGVDKFVAALEGATLGLAAAKCLTELAVAEKQPELLVALVGAAQPATAVAVLAALPGDALAKFRPQIRRLLSSTAPADAAQGQWKIGLVQALVAADTPEVTRVIAEHLEAIAAMVDDRLLGAAAATMARHNLGRDHLLPLVGNTKAAPRVRIAALDALAANASLMDEALKFRMGELLDEKTVRDRLAIHRTRRDRRKERP